MHSSINPVAPKSSKAAYSVAKCLKVPRHATQQQTILVQQHGMGHWHLKLSKDPAICAQIRKSGRRERYKSQLTRRRMIGFPVSTAVHAIEAPSIEVGRNTDDGYDLSSSEADDATASLSSSIASTYTYERGRIWAVEVRDRYPSATVRGIDIAPIQPKWVPANVSFLVDDCELDWTERDVDLAHFRFTIVFMKKTSQVLGHAFESLRPGGWIELQELQPTTLCDDETMPDDDPVKYLFEKIDITFELLGLKAKLPLKLESYLREAGFENVHC
ncbi:hypothetical protein E4U13_006562 [Claviceps humidiphila]|uniref:Uncharacterized protein n=1 Tax=Claviceps humidiphila TaxID=1294629 RepID=A0A9P7PX79_9HYPO|nr:hypothetical protein E4U13_006562 [Claviceps humidiphila]